MGQNHELRNGIFDLTKGDRVYDTMSARYGRVLKIEETSNECIEAFIKWDEQETIDQVTWVPNLRLVTE